MLIDEVTIIIKSGKGGDGIVAFHPKRGGPAGGNGGNGGSVYFVGVDDIDALSQFRFKKIIKAQDGEPGGRNNMFGKNGEDLYIKIPLGTTVTDEHGKMLFEVNDVTTSYLVTKGGKGGKGNNEFKSATNQTPRFAEKGFPGEEKTVYLEMRLIAQVGLIGLPNAGKSSLLEALTNATPKIGSYPFTTLEPNLGVMGKIILADIPGLIEGASSGKGLGIKFLKHIEKTELLIHCIDVSLDNPYETYRVVHNEFKKYNPKLLAKKEIVLLTKSDLVEAKTLAQKKKILAKTKKAVMAISVLDEKQLTTLKQYLETHI